MSFMPFGPVDEPLLHFGPTLRRIPPSRLDPERDQRPAEAIARKPDRIVSAGDRDRVFDLFARSFRGPRVQGETNQADRLLVQTAAGDLEGKRFTLSQQGEGVEALIRIRH